MTAAPPGADPVGRSRPGAPIAVLATVGVLRLVLAVGGVVVVTSMVVTGLRPHAELEGLLVVIGGVLAGPVLLYTVLAVLALTSLRRRPDGRRRLGLATSAVVVDALLALGGAAAVVRDVVGGDLRAGSLSLVGLLWLVLAVPGALALRSLRAASRRPTPA